VIHSLLQGEVVDRPEQNLPLGKALEGGEESLGVEGAHDNFPSEK